MQCFKCARHQVHQRRKDGKFKCPVCGERQSVQKVFGLASTGKPLRELVQRLNMAEGERREVAEELQAELRAAPPPTFAGWGAEEAPAAPPGGAAALRTDWSEYVEVEEEGEGEVVAPEAGVGPPSRGQPTFVTALPEGRGKGGRKRPRAEGGRPARGGRGGGRGRGPAFSSGRQQPQWQRQGRVGQGPRPGPPAAPFRPATAKENRAANPNPGPAPAARAAAEKGGKWGAYLDDEEEAEAFAEPGDGDQGRYVTAV